MLATIEVTVAAVFAAIVVAVAVAVAVAVNAFTMIVIAASGNLGGIAMGIDPLNPALCKDSVVEVSKFAGSTILDLFLPEIVVTQKNDQTPLTVADLAANKVIIERLTEIDTKLPVLTEESCDIPLEERGTWRTYWLVDPLDGTREFIKQHGEFSVNIALIHNGEPVLGVVHAPILDTTYWASRGEGAWKQIGNEQPRQIEVRHAPEKRVTVALGWATHFSSKLERFLDNLGEHSELRMGGGAKILSGGGGACGHIRLPGPHRRVGHRCGAMHCRGGWWQNNRHANEFTAL